MPVTSVPIDNSALKRTRLLIFLILGGWLAYHLLTLTVYPQAWCDEANYAVVADQFLLTGRYTLPIGFPDAVTQRNMSSVGRLFASGEAMALLIGGPHLYTVRAYGLVAWVLGVVLLYLIGRRLYREEVGLAAALVFGLAVSVYTRTHVARPDGWAAIAVLAAYWLYRRAKEKPTFWRTWLVGFAGVLAADFYIGAILFVPPMALLTLGEFGWRRRRWQPVVAYGLGVIAGLTYFAAAHAYPDPQAAYATWTGYTTSPRYSPVERSVGDTLASAAWWLWEFWWHGNRHIAGGESLLAIGGALLAARRRTAGDREIATLVGISWPLFVFLFHDKQWSQAIFWLPFSALWIAAGARDVARWLSARLRRRVAWVALLAPWLAVNVAAGLYLGYTFRTNDFETHLTEVREVIPSGATYIGRAIYWFAYPREGRFMHELGLGGLRSQHPEGVEAQALDNLLRREGIEYIIIDEGWECTFPVLQPPDATLAEWAEANCTLVQFVPANRYPSYYGEQQPKPVYFCGEAEPGGE